MKTSTRVVSCYLFSFILIVTVDMFSAGDMPSARMYFLLMPLLALSLFLFSDFSAEGIKKRIKGYRWSMMVLLIGMLTSLFIENTLSACALIFVSSFIAPFLRIRKYADQD